jgi:hypothetical protein
VYVARPDGTALIRVTPDLLSGITGYDFSPDGKQLLVSAQLNGIRSIAHRRDGSDPQLRRRATNSTPWQPPTVRDPVPRTAATILGGWRRHSFVNSQGGDGIV